MKEIKDYLHLYLGCEIYDTNPKSEKYKRYILGAAEYGYYENRLSTLKPILRPLSDMTEEEGVPLCELHATARVGSIEIVNIKKNKIDFIDGEMDSGDGWSEMRDKEVLFKYMNAEQFRYLLSKHFDLFGLIESGLAIDKSNKTIKT